MTQTFDDLFPEYWTQYRGQATNLPDSSSREYAIAINLANSTIREWLGADNIKWKELWTTLQDEDPKTFSSGTTTYDIDSMSEPPGFVYLVDTDGTKTKLTVVEPYEIEDFTGSSTFAYFTGSTGNGFTLHLEGDLSQYDGFDIDFPYQRLPNFIEDGNSVPDMSDPNFLVQGMLYRRFISTKNGMGYNNAKTAADTALANMKIKNNTGTFGNSSKVRDTSPGFGTGVRNSILR